MKSSAARIVAPGGNVLVEPIFRLATRQAAGLALRARMVRIREIPDPELREKIVAALAERRGCSAAAIPDWFELDDADFVDLLNDLKDESAEESDYEHDSRM